jgi:two-component system sensor histidine kinase EvgS
MYIPGFVLLYRALTSTVIAVDFVTTGKYGTYEIIDEKSLWFNLWIFWILLLSGAVIYMLASYIKKSSNMRIKKQVKIIMYCYICNLIFAGLSNLILVKIITGLPALGAHFSSVFAIGIYYAITRYELMSLNPYIAADEIFSKMMDLTILVDKNLKILTVNKQTESLLKFEEKEMYGKKIDLFLTDFPHFMENLEIIDKGELKSIEFESRMYNKTSDEIPVRFFVSNVKDRSGQILGYVLVMHDIRNTISLIKEIGERMSAEEKLKAAIKKAEDANKAKSEFLANISHEIRTPLNAILGFNEILRTKASDENSIEYIDAIKKGSETLLVLINDILDLSKIEAGHYDLKPSALSVRGILSEIKQVFEYKAEKKGIDLLLSVSEDVPDFIFTDSLRLRQILLNIIGNGIKFTEKGAVRIKCFVKSLPGEGKDLHITISDTGIGIYSSDKDMVYKPFYRSSVRDMSGYAGAGLGLSITKKFAEIMEGDLSFESKVGVGSTFNFVLRNIQEESSQSLLLGSNAFEDKLDYSDNTVLLIGKGKKERKILKDALISLGINAVEQEKLKDAIKNAGDKKISLIGVLASSSSDESINYIKYIKKSDSMKKVPVIAYAAGDDVSFFKAGNVVNSVIKKPVKPEVFLEEAKKYISSKPKKRKMEVLEEGVREEEKIDAGLQKNVASVLQNEYLKEWESISKSFNLNKIYDFAGSLIRLGEENCSFELSAWARELKKDAKSCDVKLITERLSGFKDVIASLNKTLG